MKEAWLEAVAKAFPEGYARPGYPLLGSEQTEARVRETQPWRLRLSLCEPLAADELNALREDVEEIRLSGAALSLQDHFPDCEVFRDDAQSHDSAWSLRHQEPAALGSLAGWELAWSKGARSRLEQTVLVDGALLKNLALLRDAQATRPEVERWVVGPAPTPTGEGLEEALIAETLAYWTGAVAGAQVLEVAQRPGEPFASLWPRLNICRLLRWEAELSHGGDACAGAGIFGELAPGAQP